MTRKFVDDHSVQSPNSRHQRISDVSDDKFKGDEMQLQQEEHIDVLRQDRLAENVLSSVQWDIFRYIPRERISTSESFARLLRILKVVFYFFLFVLFTSCLVLNKVSTVLMTSTMSQLFHNLTTSAEKQSSTVTDGLNTLIVFMSINMCFPHAIAFVVYLLKGLFGSQPWPGIGALSTILIFETIQTVSSCVIVYLVLPEMDMVRALCVMELVAFFPSLFKVFLSWPPKSGKIQQPKTKHEDDKPSAESYEVSASEWKGSGGRGRKGVYYLLSTFALLIQMAGLVLVSWGNFEFYSTSSALSGNATSEYFVSVRAYPNKSPTDYNRWIFPLCLFLKSITWWDNFVDSDLKCGSLTLLPLRRWKVRLHKLRQKTTIFSSLWNIGVIVSFPYLARYAGLPHFSSFEYRIAAIRTSAYEETLEYVPALTSSLSSLFGFLLGSLACKLLMQRASFAAPLVVSTPLAVGLVLGQCFVEFMPPYGIYKWHCPEDFGKTDFALPDSAWQLASCAVFWISMVILTEYIWYPRNSPMDKNEKLFVRPFYDAVFFSQHLMLNRRRRDKELKHNDFTDQFYFPDTEDPVSDNSSISSPRKGCPEDDLEDPPMIYACATMWHENKNEMTQLLKSIFRMDKDYATRYNLKTVDSHTRELDYYDFETHIFFDDAFELNDGKYVPNQYVRQFYDVIDDAASSVHSALITLSDPTRMVTPYGGRLTWTLPGGTKLVVHLKDKNKIRHKKRWSQCMYMYYLLGYRLVGLREETVFGKKIQVKHGRRRTDAQFLPYSLFRYLPEHIHKKAQNTFILALDGDVDFKPEAVRLLVDQMKSSAKVASACGRIHPIGEGPVVWFQQFEYALSHWLQKAAEHVFGCVLCSPGCFSLFRASALMDDNVMRRYCEVADTPREIVQFDQGEDRWLCTLLLQQGYRVTYCAAADALTYSPETFEEFYNQRRRWMPSTMANIMDLLSTFKHTIRLNDNISYPYMIYQLLIFVSSVFSPGTVVLTLAGAFNVVLGTDLLRSYILALEPVILFIVVCFRAKPKTQIIVAQVFSAIYSAVMTIVVVGTIITSVTESATSPYLIFLQSFVFLIFSAALLHPQEAICIAPSVIYLLTFPSAYLLLPLYSFCNLNVISWGTREGMRPKTLEELELEGREMEAKRRRRRQGSGLLRWLGLSRLIQDLRDFYRVVIGSRLHQDPSPDNKLDVQLDELERNDNVEAIQTTEKRNELREILRKKQQLTAAADPEANPELEQSRHEMKSNKAVKVMLDRRYELANPSWLEDDAVGLGRVETLSEKETAFWHLLIRIYLHPIPADRIKEKVMEHRLRSLRSNIVFGLLIMNGLWVVMIFQLQLLAEAIRDSFFVAIPKGDDTEEMMLVEPVGFAFLAVFGFVISLQFIGMLFHRWDTFCHIIARTEIRQKEDKVAHKLRTAERLQSLSQDVDDDFGIPPPDYYDVESSVSGYFNSGARPRVYRRHSEGARLPDHLRDNSGWATSLERLASNDKDEAGHDYVSWQAEDNDSGCPNEGGHPQAVYDRRYRRRYHGYGPVQVGAKSLYTNFRRRYEYLLRMQTKNQAKNRRSDNLTLVDVYQTTRNHSGPPTRIHYKHGLPQLPNYPSYGSTRRT